MKIEQVKVPNVKNITVLIDIYNPFGGASKAAVNFAKHIKLYGYNVFIICNKMVYESNKHDNVFVLDDIDKCKTFVENHHIDIVHYFKSANPLGFRTIFYKFNRALKDCNKVVSSLITVCQQPSYPGTILTPYEIKNSDFIIFIDKTAYNDSLYKFIPNNRKSWMYLIRSKDLPIDVELEKFVKKKYDSDKNTIVFGRGSTLNKCPKDTIELFDRIRINKEKKFIIVGGPNSPNGLSKKIRRQHKDNDVLLYYLPKNIYSSIDGSLITAMSLGVAVVVYGPSAPKEMIKHGYNGYIAETKEELVYYAELLAKDVNHREYIGRNARTSILEDAPTINWKDVHVNIIETIYNQEKEDAIVVPVITTIYIYMRKYLHLIYRYLNKIFTMSFFKIAGK